MAHSQEWSVTWKYYKDSETKEPRLGRAKFYHLERAREFADRKEKSNEFFVLGAHVEDITITRIDIEKTYTKESR